MMVEREIVVVGGGIVGLSTALALARGESPRPPLVLEKEADVASHQTGHNSGVIHSGIYYRPGSLKARYTVEGARRMVEFCREHGLPHEVCGKVVVATNPDEVARLHEIYPRAQANGVPGVELIGPERLREIEPAAAGLAAFLVPSTGIVDYSAVAQRYAELVCAAGGQIRTQTQVLGIRRDGNRWVLETTAGVVRARYLVNCAGLHSDRVARMAGIRPAVRIVPFRGEYYKLAPEREGLVRGLIYPVPDPSFPFLGVHFTRMVRGGVEAGPNAVLSFKREGYRKTDFNARDAWSTFAYPAFWRLAFRYWRTGAGEFYRSFNQGAFVHALQRLLPDLRREDLVPGGSGVRAQAVDTNGNLLDDFCIETGPGAIHVLNAPSPAATASLPIGEAIAAQARGMFGSRVGS
jgi:(S)-2-hydroxyglutarate dehydrogenase